VGFFQHFTGLTNDVFLYYNQSPGGVLEGDLSVSFFIRNRFSEKRVLLPLGVCLAFYVSNEVMGERISATATAVASPYAVACAAVAGKGPLAIATTVASFYTVVRTALKHQWPDTFGQIPYNRRACFQKIISNPWIAVASVSFTSFGLFFPVIQGYTAVLPLIVSGLQFGYDIYKLGRRCYYGSQRDAFFVDMGTDP
jgi:hypothetical protein